MSTWFMTVWSGSRDAFISTAPTTSPPSFLCSHSNKHEVPDVASFSLLLLLELRKMFMGFADQICNGYQINVPPFVFSINIVMEKRKYVSIVFLSLNIAWYGGVLSSMTHALKL